MPGACTRGSLPTPACETNGLLRARRSARFADAGPDRRFAERTAELEMTDHAALVHEEGARKAEHTEAPRGLPLGVEHRLKPVEAELLEERRDLVTRLLQVNLEEHHIRLGCRDALEGGHLLPAGLTPGRPEVDHDDLAAIVGKTHDLPSVPVPFEVRSVRRDPPAGPLVLDLVADDGDLGLGRRRLREGERRPYQRYESRQRDRADEDRSEPAGARGRLRVLGNGGGRSARPTHVRRQPTN